MRVGDFAVEVVPRNGGSVRETESGHVLARPGQVYALRLRNFGPLRCVAEISIDGHAVSAGGLVLEPWSTEELERPIEATEDGRFTVFAEGDERVFGPDGGRDNAQLGLIEVHFRRELPTKDHRRPLPPTILQPRFEFPEIGSPIYNGSMPNGSPDRLMSVQAGGRVMIGGIMTRAIAPAHVTPDAPMEPGGTGEIERAAGTGLTGHSTQRVVPTHLGPLESEPTVVQLRLVIGTEEAIHAPRSLPEPPSPLRPAARP